MSILFSDVKYAQAIGNSVPPQQTIVKPLYQDTSRLIKPSQVQINWDIKPKIMMSSLSNSIGSIKIIIKSELQNSQWLKDFASVIRGGDDKLIRCIIAKASKNHLKIPSLAKALKMLSETTIKITTKTVEITVQTVTHDNFITFLRVFAEINKAPNIQPSIFVEGLGTPLPSHRTLNQVQKNAYLSPFRKSTHASTKCYGHQKLVNIPRSVTENLSIKAVNKLSTSALKNPLMSKEYKSVKNAIEQGTHPANLSDRSTYISDNKVLIKKHTGRYLVEVSDSNVEILGMSPREIYHDALDVFIYLDDSYCNNGFCYLVEITTPEFISKMMGDKKNAFLEPSYPYIIVSELTNETIRSAIEDFVNSDDGIPWLKLYHIIPKLGIQDIDEILDRKTKEEIELDIEIDAEFGEDSNEKLGT